MISRVIAEFSSSEAAESALNQIKATVDYVYSGSVMSAAGSPKRHFLSRGTNYALLPDSFSNSITSPENEIISAHSPRRKKATACIICGSGAVENVISAVNAMGGMNVRSVI